VCLAFISWRIIYSGSVDTVLYTFCDDMLMNAKRHCVTGNSGPQRTLSPTVAHVTHQSATESVY